VPEPDEIADLNMGKNIPVLVTTRTTHAADGTPLMVETERTAADAAQLAYTLTATKPNFVLLQYK
jgi:DNA-binding GntR family transcriptional regulator